MFNKMLSAAHSKVSELQKPKAPAETKEPAMNDEEEMEMIQSPDDPPVADTKMGMTEKPGQERKESWRDVLKVIIAHSRGRKPLSHILLAH